MKRILLSAGFALLAGCGQDGQVGGGGIEIPNGLNLTVASADKKPVPNAAVRLLARESWTRRTAEGGSVVLDSGLTDSDGRISFKVPQGEGYWLEASAGGMGLRIQGDSGETRTVYLSPLSKLTGYLGSGPISGVKVHLAGSSRVAVTDARGRFEFDSLPQSGYSMVASNGTGRRFAQLGEVGVGLDPVDAQGLANDTSRVLLDDFSDGDNVWLLDGLFGRGCWWIAGNDPDLAKIFGIAEAWQGVKTGGQDRWMSISVDAAAMTAPWAGLGLDLGPQGGVLPELSKASAFVLRAQATGTWNLQVLEDRGTESALWSTPIEIPAAWGVVRISTASLVAQSGAQESWNARPRKVRKMVFWTAASGQIDLSELSVEGANLGDWGR